VARVRVRSGILDHVFTDTITTTTPLRSFLSSLQTEFFGTLLATP
jgi:hypothetical protein